MFYLSIYLKTPVIKNYLTQVCFEDDSSAKRVSKKVAPTNSIPMTTLKSTTTSTPSHHVVPRPTPGLKMQNAWGESRSVDLICS